uniref:Uncharacterized protein n=1 Tax=Amphimedon queenslandica TaxID=400682 RepID=A0A1X7UUM3_AMPQE
MTGIEPSFTHSIASIYILCFTRLKFYYDMKQDYFKGVHGAAGFFAILVLLFLIVLPTLYILLYPLKWFQKVLDCLHLRKQLLISLGDVFTGPYKNGTENTYDYCFMAGLYLLVYKMIKSCYRYHKKNNLVANQYQDNDYQPLVCSDDDWIADRMENPQEYDEQHVPGRMYDVSVYSAAGLECRINVNSSDGINNASCTTGGAGNIKSQYLLLDLCMARFWSMTGIEPSFTHSIASMYILCFTQLAATSFKLLSIAPKNGTLGLNNAKFYYDMKQDYFKGVHGAAGFFAVLVLLLLIVLPTLDQLLYPFKWFHKLLDRLHLWKQLLISLGDVFTGPYKNGAENAYDYRFMAGLYLLAKIIILGLLIYVLLMPFAQAMSLPPKPVRTRSNTAT